MSRIVWITLVNVQASFTWVKLRPPVELITDGTVAVIRSVSIYTPGAGLSLTTMQRPAIWTHFFAFIDIFALTILQFISLIQGSTNQNEPVFTSSMCNRLK